MPSNEMPLVYGDARIALLRPILVQNNLEEGELAKQIQKLGLEVKTESEGIRTFSIAGFGLSKEYVENTPTLEISGFEMEVPGIGVTIPVKVFLRIQKYLKCYILYFTFKFPKSTTDDLIFLKDSVNKEYLRVSVISVPRAIRNLMGSRHDLSLKEMFENYQTLLSQVFTVKFEGEFRSCIEIREILDSVDNPRKILNKYPKQMYGLLAADEGWRFVPKNYAEERIFDCCWSSRDYFVVMGKASGTLNLNFRKSKTRKEYLRFQKSVREKYDCPIEDYFTYDFEIAGAENGGLMRLELIATEATVFSALLEGKIPEKPGDIVEFRTNIAKNLDSMKHVRIPETSVFAEKLRREISIPRYEELIKKIGEIDRALDITFSEERHKQNEKVSSRMQILSMIFAGAVGLSIADILQKAEIISGWPLLIIGLVLWALIAALCIKVIRVLLEKIRKR